MQKRVVRTVLGLALVCTLLGGLAVSHLATSETPAQPLLACGDVHLSPCF